MQEKKEIELKEMISKTKDMKCPKHNYAASFTLVGYPGEIKVTVCCKEFANEIEKACDVILANHRIFLN